MGCFLVQKSKKRSGSEQPPAKADQAAAAAATGIASLDESNTTSPRPVLSAPPSFKSRVRSIQHAQRFINSNPKLRSSHPSYRSRAGEGEEPGPASPVVPLGGRARSATELGTSLFDIAAAYSNTSQSSSKPMPLPSPQLSPKRSGYPLPLPYMHQCGASPSPNPYILSDMVNANHATKGKVFPSDLKPLPLPKEAVLLGVRCFSYEELAAACNNFSPDCCIEEDEGSTFSGSIMPLHGKGERNQDVVVMRLWEKGQQSIKEWISEVSPFARLQSPNLCKIIGCYAEEGTSERMLVYEKLKKGSLYNLLFGISDSPPLDWIVRMKIALGAAQGLANLHEKLPDRVLYRDFRTSYVQVDSDYSSKISGYRLFNAVHSSQVDYCGKIINPRVNAYCAPETLSRGEVSLKSNVWSFGVMLLELMSGRQNMDEKAIKEGKNSLVKWAKPLLIDEARLFLIMDPKLQGRFSSKGSKMIADLALQCLEKDPTKRPDMSKASETVKLVYEMRYVSRRPLKEPSNNGASTTLVAPSFTSSSIRSSILERQEIPVFDRSPTKFDLIESPPLRPLIIPPRSRATSCNMEEGSHPQDYYCSAPLEHLKGF